MLLGEKWSRTDLGHVLLHPFPTHNVYKKAVNRIIFLVQGDTDLIRRFQSIHSNHPSLACVNFFKEIKLEVLVSYFRFSNTIPAGCFPFCDGLTPISFERIQSDQVQVTEFETRDAPLWRKLLMTVSITVPVVRKLVEQRVEPRLRTLNIHSKLIIHVLVKILHFAQSTTSAMINQRTL